MNEKILQLRIRGELKSDPLFAFTNNLKGNDNTEFTLCLSENKWVGLFTGYMRIAGKNYFATAKPIDAMRGKVVLFTGKDKNIELAYDFTKEGVNCQLLKAEVGDFYGRKVLFETPTRFGTATKVETLITEEQLNFFDNYLSTVVLKDMDMHDFANYKNLAKKMFLDKVYVSFYSEHFDEQYRLLEYRGYETEKPIDFEKYFKEIDVYCEGLLKKESSFTEDKMKEEIQELKQLALCKLIDEFEDGLSQRSYKVLEKVINTVIGTKLSSKTSLGCDIIFAKLYYSSDFLRRYSIDTPEQIFAKNFIESSKKIEDVLRVYYKYANLEKIEVKDIQEIADTIYIADVDCDYRKLLDIFLTLRKISSEKDVQFDTILNDFVGEVYNLNSEYSGEMC